jgi:hypothetical protein
MEPTEEVELAMKQVISKLKSEFGISEQAAEKL